MDVTKRLRMLMEERGWSEYRLAKNTQLSASTIANIFHRGTVPSVATLEIICKAFGISLSEFFSDGNMVSLSDEQKELLSKWALLSQEQKQILLELISKMN